MLTCKKCGAKNHEGRVKCRKCDMILKELEDSEIDGMCDGCGEGRSDKEKLCRYCSATNPYYVPPVEKDPDKPDICDFYPCEGTVEYKVIWQDKPLVNFCCEEHLTRVIKSALYVNEKVEVKKC